MKQQFQKFAKLALFFVYLVIIAGALVRMTGSGMGCPDWPKCFGYIIPPTDIKQLLWKPNHQYNDGQVIIKDEKLLVATGNFKTETLFEEAYWRAYTKHDYAIFNATETWIEYINRLFGALAGFFVFIMAVLSFWYWKKNKLITVLSWLTVLLMGVQAWLGAKVVYSVLNPMKITIHMLVALIIVAILIYIIQIVSPRKEGFIINKNIKYILFVSLIFTLIQIILGTQVRQFVDEQIKFLGDDQMGLILQNPKLNFYIHRSFSILILGLNVYLFLINKKQNLGLTKINWVMILLGIEIISGIIMSYFGFPFGSQTVHLVIASILFGLQFYMILTYRTEDF